MISTINSTDSFALALLIVSLLFYIISYFWWIVVTFSTSVWWGIFCLFVPFASLVFLFLHWKKAKGVFLLSLLAGGLTLWGIHLSAQTRGGSWRFLRYLMQRTNAVKRSQFATDIKAHIARAVATGRDSQQGVNLYVGSKNDSLIQAVQNGDIVAVQSFLIQGADINARSELGLTPLMEAAALGFDDIVQILLKIGANVGLKSNEGKTAFDLARENHRTTIMQILDESKKDSQEAVASQVTETVHTQIREV